jgi:hypothetical protein
MIELAKDERHEDVAGGDGGVRVVFLDGLEAGEGAVVVKIVEVLVRLADLRGEVDWVGMVVRLWNLDGAVECIDWLTGGGRIRVREGWSGQQIREKEEAESFDAAFYSSSPKPWTAGFMRTLLL